MEIFFDLLEQGQSYWLDSLSREMIRGGELALRVREQGLRGVTSNPAIFHKAISSGADYDDQIAELAAAGASVADIYETLVVTDRDSYRTDVNASTLTTGEGTCAIEPEQANCARATRDVRTWRCA